jgi:hypothetical protein
MNYVEPVEFVNNTFNYSLLSYSKITCHEIKIQGLITYHVNIY